MKVTVIVELAPGEAADGAPASSAAFAVAVRPATVAGQLAAARLKAASPLTPGQWRDDVAGIIAVQLVSAATNTNHAVNMRDGQPLAIVPTVGEPA